MKHIVDLVWDGNGKVEAKETSMLRDEEEYSKPKVLYQIKVEKD